MTQPLTPPPSIKPTYSEQVERYKDVSARLLVALQAQSSAKAASDSARDAYDDKRRELIASGAAFTGLQGRATAEEKDAQLCRLLVVELRAVRAARDALRLAETELEAARVVERAERETLRSIQRDYEFHAQARAQAI